MKHNVMMAGVAAMVLTAAFGCASLAASPKNSVDFCIDNAVATAHRFTPSGSQDGITMNIEAAKATCEAKNAPMKASFYDGVKVVPGFFKN